jgi:hypothetical protein
MWTRAGGEMKVLLLTDAQYELAKRKVAQLVHCTDTNAELMRGWKQRNPGCKYLGEALIRRAHIEAIRLHRILEQ